MYAPLINSFLLIVLLSFVLYNAVQIRKVKANSSNLKKEPYTDGLRAYVESSLRQGYSTQQIKQTLLRQNWPPQKIEEAFRKW